MAGGANWNLVRIADKKESWKRQITAEDGTVEYVELWERKDVEVEIRVRLRVDQIGTLATSGGQVGATSAYIQYHLGAGQFRSVYTRVGISPALACVKDELTQEQPFADWYLRDQTWLSLGEDEKVGEETPA
jgi:hypothetical protein